MPKKWTTKEQALWLKARVKGFNEARSHNRGTAYARTVHTEFSKLWPEREALYPTEIGAPKRRLSERQQLKVKKLVKRRRGQILSWLQRNGYMRGRTVSKAVKVLMRGHRKRRRAPQPVEAYAKLYPQKVNEEYQRRKGDEKLTNGKRLNLLRKIAAEFLEDASDEVLDAVAAKQEEMRKVLEKAQDAALDDNLETSALEQYVAELPSLLTMIIQDIRQTCPRWGFLLLAAGPMPNSDKVHVFDVYDGPTNTLDYGFQDAVVDFEEKYRRPMGQFMQDRDAEFIAQAKAAEKLAGIKMSDVSESESEKSDPDPPLSSPPRLKLTKSPRGTSAHHPSSDTSSDSEADVAPARTAIRRPQRPAVLSSDSDSESDAPPQPPAVRKTSKKHPIEEMPIQSDHSKHDDGDDEDDEDKCHDDEGDGGDEWGGLEDDDEWGGIDGSDDERPASKTASTPPPDQDMVVEEDEDIAQPVRPSSSVGSKKLGGPSIVSQKTATSSSNPLTVAPTSPTKAANSLNASQAVSRKSEGTPAERRAESTRKRLETLKINKEAKLAVAKAQEEQEKARKELERLQLGVTAVSKKSGRSKGTGNAKNAAVVDAQPSGNNGPDSRNVESSEAPPIEAPPLTATSLVVPPPPSTTAPKASAGVEGVTPLASASTTSPPPTKRKHGTPKGLETPPNDVPPPSLDTSDAAVAANPPNKRPRREVKPPARPDATLAPRARGKRA